LQITRVALKNIKNHAEAEWSFAPGVIAICGPNGAGKTTILEAIAWALFDHLDYNRDDFVKRGAKRGQVTVSFVSDLDQREYTVHRDTGGTYYVYDPDTKTRLLEQKGQVVPWLQQHLGVEPGTDLAALFKSTIGVPQGTFTFDFTLQAAKRKVVFDQILKVEEYREASDNLRETLRHIESRLTEADRRLAEAEGELRHYDQVKQEHDEAAVFLAGLESDLAAAEEARACAAREAAELDEVRRLAEAERGSIERLRVKLEITRGNLTSAREAAEQARGAAERVEAARAGYENYLAAGRRLSEVERQRVARDELRGRASGVERELTSARVAADRGRERVAEIAEARAELGRLAAPAAEQERVEGELARLRERRGEALGLQRSADTLDRELEQMRKRYFDLGREAEASEAQRVKAERADALEDERMLLDSEISQKEQSLNNYKAKREWIESLRREVRRLEGERAENAREAARLGPLAARAAGRAEAEARAQAEAERVARLRAEVARDAEMVAGLEGGGWCPLLTEKCLNLKPGESLDARFRSGLEQRRAQIAEIEAGLTALAAEAQGAREAEAEARRLPKLQAEAARIARELEAQQERSRKIEDETLLGSGVTDGEIKELKHKRVATEALLRDAREAQRLYARAEVLGRTRDEVKRAGEAKRRERDELGRRLAQLGDLEAQLAAAEAQLAALGDPRGRAGVLGQVVAREGERRREAEAAALRAGEVAAALAALAAELAAYAEVDAEVAAAGRERAASEPDYQTFIAHEQIAATLAAREHEAAAIAADVEQTETGLAATLGQLAALEARYDAERHLRAQAELDRWRERATQLAAQLAHTREQHSRLRAQLARLDEVRARRREELAARERAAQLRETADFIRDILQKAAPYIVDSYLFSISLEANQLFREITGRHDVTLNWNKEYEITLEEEGRERPFANLSGGEQMAAALAVRLALLKELSEVNLAFFDEPTTNMDEERRRNLAQQIGRIKDFQQLFVISHDDTFEGFTDQVILLGERN